MKTAALTLVVDSATEINQLHSENCQAAEQTIEKAIRIGQLLSEERGRCKHGQWLPWLKANIKFAQNTAHRYQRVYEQRAKLSTVDNLSEAYRITLPKANRKQRKAKTKTIIIQMFLGACRIENPLSSWHVATDQNQENNESIICTKCWRHSTGGETEFSSKERRWTYACHCPGSQRTGPITEK